MFFSLFSEYSKPAECDGGGEHPGEPHGGAADPPAPEKTVSIFNLWWLVIFDHKNQWKSASLNRESKFYTNWSFFYMDLITNFGKSAFVEIV